MLNIDEKTVSGFGDEWRRFDQSALDPAEREAQFERYFRIFPWHRLPSGAVGFDMGCGSGRWARLVAPRVGELHCVDASDQALAVAREHLSEHGNCHLIHASVGDAPLTDNSMDFGYALGVLHHVPNTDDAIAACVAKLKPGAPFLVYLYYAFDNRPWWFRALWKLSDWLRLIISRFPRGLRYATTQAIAGLVYFPLARLSWLLERAGLSVESIPLSAYRASSYYTMRTDALDRFGTRLEKRFTKTEIETMMGKAGLAQIEFSDSLPYWCAVGIKNC